MKEEMQAVLGHDRSTYIGVATFLRGEPSRTLHPGDVAVLGVPFDSSTSGRSGCRYGPRAMRNASLQLWGHHTKYRLTPSEVLRLVDYGDADVIPPDIVRNMASVEATICTILAAGATCLMLGGDHSNTLPSLRAHADKYGPLGLIHIDAHADTWDSDFDDLPYSHGTFVRRAVEEGLIDQSRYAMVGIRGATCFLEDLDIARDHCTRMIDIDEAFAMGMPALVQTIRDIVGDGPTYLTFDIDACDPAYAPGTGTPEVGGFTSYQALQLIRGLDGVQLVGADVIEVNPLYDTGEITALLGATLGFEIISLWAKQRAAGHS